MELRRIRLATVGDRCERLASFPDVYVHFFQGWERKREISAFAGDCRDPTQRLLMICREVPSCRDVERLGEPRLFNSIDDRNILEG